MGGGRGWQEPKAAAGTDRAWGRASSGEKGCRARCWLRDQAPARWLGGWGQGPAPSFNPGRAAGDRASAQDLGRLGHALGSPELGEVAQDCLAGAVQNRGLL